MSEPAKKGAFRVLLPYLLLFCALFYALPAPSLINPAASGEYLINTLFVITPAVCFALHIHYGLNHGFAWYAPLLDCAVFIPAIFIFYDYTVFVYFFGYIILSYIGMWVGYSLYKNRNRRNGKSPPTENE